MFIIVFITVLIIAICIIAKSWFHMKKVSGGYYKNAGQDIILWCDKSEKEVIQKLENKTIDDTLVYDFFEKMIYIILKFWVYVVFEKKTFSRHTLF